MGVYRQLINALDKDNRPEEAHNFWMKKIGTDLHSVPWDLCTLMISIYYRSNMLERLVKLFKGLQSYDRKPPDKLVVQKVADAYEMLGLLEEKNRVLEKYNYLFTEKRWGNLKKSKKGSQKKVEKSVERNQTETYNEESNTVSVQMSSSSQSRTMDDARVTPSTQQNQKIDLIETVHRMIRS
ncbi:hypothetical protein AQUCO_01000085v1 [Aquilegia coerulea]|uniref:Pentatricopeptide repeat-containing protein n=1 Tax=Aquilegia coerulea TaxID=218851 RepID=A0A2G5E897_AQUCA|nr:hypothetical protein AQUCO_01000085v1 [Aquilegia coerulea]